jgi:hypothetical protein
VSEEIQARAFHNYTQRSNEIYRVSAELMTSLILPTASLPLTLNESPLFITHVFSSAGEIHSTKYLEETATHSYYLRRYSFIS